MGCSINLSSIFPTFFCGNIFIYTLDVFLEGILLLNFCTEVRQLPSKSVSHMMIIKISDIYLLM